MLTTRLHRYHSLRSTGRRRKVFDNVFKEYRSMLGGRTKELLYRMALILDAALDLNRITRAKRQCSMEKQALDIYNTSLNHVSKIIKTLRNAHRVEQLEEAEEDLKCFNEKFDQVQKRPQLLLSQYGLTMDKGTMHQKAKNLNTFVSYSGNTTVHLL